MLYLLYIEGPIERSSILGVYEISSRGEPENKWWLMKRRGGLCIPTTISWRGLDGTQSVHPQPFQIVAIGSKVSSKKGLRHDRPIAPRRSEYCACCYD